MKTRTVLIAAILFATLLAWAASLSAQVSERKILTLDGAKKAAAAAEADAKRRNLPVVIVVVDDAGNLLYLERLDSTQVGSIRVGIGKARTAAHFKRPTKFFEDQVKNGRIVTLALEDFTPLQGGVPIFSAGQFVGAIGVSGDSPQVDEEIAMAGAAVIP
ncbi:MAG TPA: heme-binding protein [Thermoanaerobaculia bacterium]|jgi:glc operon protein GlcG